MHVREMSLFDSLIPNSKDGRSPYQGNLMESWKENVPCPIQLRRDRRDERDAQFHFQTHMQKLPLDDWEKRLRNEKERLRGRVLSYGRQENGARNERGSVFKW